MSKPFLITGLPRSRTAWMAAAATEQISAWHSICYHEPLAWLDRWEDIFQTIWGDYGGEPYVGISDHGLGFHLPEIMRRESPRTLIIERRIVEVKASLAAIGLHSGNFCDLLTEALAYQHPRIRRVPYEALADTDVVMDCLRWLMPRASLNRERIAALQSCNIQADVEATKAIAVKRAGEVAKFLPLDVLRRLRA